MLIRQSHIQQEYVHSTFRKVGFGVAHAKEVRQVEAVDFLLAEHFTE
jgi:hypothetical protein